MRRLIFGTCLTVFAVSIAIATFDMRNVSGQAVRTQDLQTATANLGQLQALTARMLDVNKQFQNTKNLWIRGALSEQLRVMAIERKDLLTALMRDNPALVLQVALPDHILASLHPSLRGYFEQSVDLDGELEVMYQENDSESRLLHFLVVGDARFPLHFSGHAPGGLLTGDRVHVRGVRVGDEIALDGVSDASDSSAASATGLQVMQSTTYVAPNTFGQQKVLVLLVNFQDNTTQPWTIDQVRNTVFTSVNSYYLEASYQQTWLTGDVFGWFTLPIASTCTESTIGTYAKQAAAAAGINTANYNHVVYAYPTVSCGWTGSSTLGGTPSQSWINGSMIVRTVGHELGHGMGLYHSSAWDCGSQVVGSTCSSVEYGDVADIMGQPGITGHFNAYQKERLGWLGYGSSPPLTTVTSSGTYWLDPYESAGTNAKALKILKSTDPTTGKSTWYYVEFRRPAGFDGFISGNSNVMNGVMIHMGTDSAGYNYLLDLTPDTSSWSDAALDSGRSYNDPGSNVTISTVSVSNSGASVSVAFGPQPCMAANPSLTMSPASVWVSGGAVVNYQLTVTNNDTGCSASNFSVRATVPAGWSATLDNPLVTINPGSSATVNLSVASPVSALDGYYTIAANAANNANSYQSSASVTCSIMSGLGVSVGSDQSSYTRSQTATLTSNVTAAGSPVSGAAVNFTITKTNGTKVSATATTDTTGTAVYKYRFNKQKDPVGTYQVAAGANMNGVVGSGATSFVVK